MLAMECSKPLVTKVMIGTKQASRLPGTSRAAVAMKTAKQTSQLQRIARMKATSKDSLHLAAAMLTACSATTPCSHRRDSNINEAKNNDPRKLPTSTSPQFSASFPQDISPCSAATVSRLLPVKSSAPQITTSISPMENTLPASNRDIPMPQYGATSWLTTVESWAPKAI